ncbi:uncharacterized protein CBL_20425 [Carabus blaptoides fortunei]
MKRITGIPNYLKVLCALHVFGHGSYQVNVGGQSHLAVSQPVVSRCITAVTRIMNDILVHTWIKFPVHNEAIRRNMNLFYQKYGFPSTLGAIDCTHVAIIAPPLEHEIYPVGPYYNRKGFYSINVQIITDVDLNILNMNARFPGFVHDSAIWMMSGINRHLRNLYLQDNLPFHLIGDEGYPLSPWLLECYPSDIEENSPHGRFNRLLRRARMTIERLNGVLKGRFRCLLKHRTLNYNPEKAAEIIFFCGVLHNVANYFNVPMPEEEHIEEQDGNEINIPAENFFEQGSRKRDRIAEQYFI